MSVPQDNRKVYIDNHIDADEQAKDKLDYIKNSKNQVIKSGWKGEYNRFVKMTGSIGQDYTGRLEEIMLVEIKRARFYKYLNIITSIMVIIINASIPITLNVLPQLLKNMFNINFSGSGLSSTISVIATIIISITTFTNTRDNWFRYRKCVQKIKKEVNYFNRKVNQYSTGNAGEQFTINLEKIVDEELNLWENSNCKSSNKEKITQDNTKINT